MNLEVGLCIFLFFSVSVISSQFPSMLSNHEQLREEIKKSFHKGYKAALEEHRMSNIDKRYNIATLNQAARNRNSLLNSFGGDPYGMGSTMLSKQQITFGRKKRSLESKKNLIVKRYIGSIQNTLQEAYTSGYKAGKEMIMKIHKENSNDEKRFTIERLNHAARHRNVYLDAAGGDPYGGSSVVSSQQHILWNRGKRSLN